MENQIKQGPRRIEVRLKVAYGKTHVYPANEAARLICQMLGTKTIPTNVLKTFAALGHDIVEVKEANDFLSKLKG